MFASSGSDSSESSTSNTPSRLSDGTRLSSSSVGPQYGDSVTLNQLARYDIEKLRKLRGEPDPYDKCSEQEKLLQSLASYFSTRRDKIYRQKLEQKLKPKLVQLGREDRYSELCLQVTKDALRVLIGSQDKKELLSQSEVGKLIELMLCTVLKAYEDAMLSRLKPGENITDEGPTALLADMETYLRYQIAENELAKSLADKTSAELKDFLAKAEQENGQIQAKSVEVQTVYATYTEDTTIVAKGISRHSVGKGREEFLDIAPSLAVQAMDMFEEKNGMTLLDEAIKLGDLTLIANMLAYTKACSRDVLRQLLALSRKKIAQSKNSTKLLMNLIGGAYLFDSELGCRLKAEYDGSKSRSINIARSDGTALELELVLSTENFTEIADQILAQADDKTLVILIQGSGQKVWPHNCGDRWAKIHAEVTQRYLQENNDMPSVVWEVLKEKQKKHQRFKQLAHFYEDAIVHVVTEYRYAPQHYAEKARVLLTVLSVAVDLGYPLTQVAENVANAVTMPKSLMSNKRGCSLFSLTKTQSLVKNAKDKLQGITVIPQVLQPPVVNSTPTKTEIRETLVSLEGSEAAQEATRQRAAIARAVFKNTLDYLEKQCNKPNPDQVSIAKKAIMDNLIATYSSDKTPGARVFVAAVQAQLAKPSSDSDHPPTLMTKRCWWAFWQPKSAELLRKDFALDHQGMLAEFMQNKVI